MRLGFYYSALYKTAEGYETFGPFVRYVEELTRHFDEAVVFAPVFDKPIPYRGVSLPSERVKVVELPPFLRHVQALPHYWTVRKTLKRHLPSVDVVIATHICPFSELFYQLGNGRIPVIYFAGIDPIEAVAKSERYRGWRNTPVRIAARLYFWYLHRVTRPCLYMANGKVIADRLRRVHPRVEIVRSSVLRQEDFLAREDTCNAEPIRLLCVSYLEERKDLPALLKALRLLLDRGHKVELTIVGDGPVRASLGERARELELGDAFHLLGPVNFGPALNRVYASADIFVFASRIEGNPRVIVEAMAHSLPVVTTLCGSVTEHIRDGETGLLVPFQDAEAIANAVERLIDDAELRRCCIRNGFAEVQGMTVERFIEIMANHAKAELESIRKRRSTAPCKVE